jgi:hypothetical protein
LRSPFPTILILRGSDVREAEDLCDIQGRVTEDIAISNEARLRSIGFQRLSNVFAGIFNSSQRDNGEAVRELAEIQAQRQNLTSDLVACQVGREVYEFDGLDGLETDTLWRNKDPVGWFPPPEELTDS